MKKLFLTLCMCFAVMTASAQTLTWNDIVEIFQEVMSESGSEYEEAFASVGADCKFSSSYNKAQKTLEMVFNFYEPDLVEIFTDSDLAEFKNNFAYGFVGTALANGDTNVIKMILNVMERNNGKIKIIFKSVNKGQPISKSTTVTAADLKNVARNNFGVRF